MTDALGFDRVVISPGSTRVDGYGLTDLRVGGTVGSPTSPIPLPAAGWLLVAALGGLAVMGRRARA